MRGSTKHATASWPADWRRLRLADTGRWLSGGTPSTSNDAYWGGDIPWISGASMKNFHVSDSPRRLSLLGAKNGSRLVEPGTALFVVRGMSLKSEFRIGVAERRVAFGQDVKALIPIEGIDPYFLAYAIRVRTPEILAMVEETSHGTGRLDTARLKELEIGVPPLEEQRRIVAVHAAFERRIEALERMLNKLGTIRQALKDSGVSGTPTRLGDVLEVTPQNGYSPPETPEWTGLLALGLGCLTSEGFSPRQIKRVPNTATAQRFRLRDGDLLMSRANTRELVGLVGRYKGIGQPCIYPDLMMRLRPDEDRCLASYLELALSSSAVRTAVQSEARGTSESMVKISASVVEALQIPLPSVEEQREAVEALSLLDARIAAQRAVVAKLRAAQSGVVEKLLSGGVQAMAA